MLAAEQQSAGRGRLGRAWVAPPRAALTFSVLLRPAAVPRARLGWLPLLAGVAVAAAIRAQAGVDAQLKWPNDVLVGGAKLAGILAEAAGDAVVVGIGLNVSTGLDELPPPGPRRAGRDLAGYPRAAVCSGPAGPGRAAGRDPGRPGALVPGLVSGHGRCRTVRPARGIHPACAPPSAADVRVELPGGQLVTGLATGLDPRWPAAGPRVRRTPKWP